MTTGPEKALPIRFELRRGAITALPLAVSPRPRCSIIAASDNSSGAGMGAMPKSDLIVRLTPT